MSNVVGGRLDVSPDLLFTLRGVDHQELIAVDTEAAVSVATSSGKSKKLAASNLSDVFGIDLDSGDQTAPITQSLPTKNKKKTARPPVATKSMKKQVADRKKSKKSPRPAKSSAKSRLVKKKK